MRGAAAPAEGYAGLRGRAAALAYRLGSAVHWSPRERALARALGTLGVGEGARLVDVGSGLGQLAALAAARGSGYLGLEPDPHLRAHAARRYGRVGARFAEATAAEARAHLEPGDVVVLNGVAHHLADAELSDLLAAARPCRALVVSDHWYRPGGVSALNRWLQEHDRGRFVRDYAYFEALPGFALECSEVFAIGPLGTRLWLYFCNGYRSEGSRR